MKEKDGTDFEVTKEIVDNTVKKFASKKKEAMTLFTIPVMTSKTQNLH